MLLKIEGTPGETAPDVASVDPREAAAAVAQAFAAAAR